MSRHSLRVLPLLWSFVLSLLICSSASAGDADQGYVLGSEDVFTVTVQRHPEFSGDFLVPPSGVVDLPVAGSTTVSGLSLNQLTAVIADKLKSRLLRPEVTVTLKLERMKRVYVLGQVRAPGVFDLKPGWSFAEAISAAGGIVPTLESRDVMVTLQSAATKEKRSMPLDDALAQKPDQRIVLNPGDVIEVDALEMVPVYVSGQVKAPGMYELRSDSVNVLAAISQAGGATDEASLATVRIVRSNGKEEVVDLSPSLVQGKSANLPKVGRGDMVIVPELLNRFAVLGYVTKPGYYPMPSGRTYTLADAVALAEGADKRARLSRVGLVRVENGKETRKIYDLGKFLRKGDTSQNPTVQAGDLVYVPETDRPEIATILNALSSTALFFSAVRR